MFIFVNAFLPSVNEVPLLVNSSDISDGVKRVLFSSSLYCLSNRNDAATCGAAIDVPDKALYNELSQVVEVIQFAAAGTVEFIKVPGAKKSVILFLFEYDAIAL